MRRAILSISGLIAVAALLAAVPAARAELLIVGFDRTDVSAGQRDDVLRDAAGERVETVVAAPTLAVLTAIAQPGAALAQVRRRLEQDPRVAWVAEDAPAS